MDKAKVFSPFPPVEDGGDGSDEPIVLSSADRATISLLRAIISIKSVARQAPAFVAGLEQFPELLSAADAVIREMGWAEDQ